MAKRGRTTRAILIIFIILLLIGAGVLGYLYVSKANEAPSKQVRVTLNLNGGYFEDDPLGYSIDGDGNYVTLRQVGQAFGTLPSPSKDGFVFSGWTYENFDSSIIKATDIIDIENDFTLIACWQAEAIRDYVINYYDENNNVIKDADILQATNKSEVTVEPIKIDGYTFDASRSELTQVIGENTVFNLYYNANEYHIKYSIVASGHEYNEMTTFKYGTNVNLISMSEIQRNDGNFVIAGKVFDYWLTENGQQLLDGATITKDDMVTLGFSLDFSINADDTLVLNAVYREETFKLTYFSQGQEYNVEDYKYNALITPPTAPSIEGYRFLGWYTVDTGATGTNVEGKELYNFDIKPMPNYNFSLYAGYELRQYSLNLVLNGGRYENGESNLSIYTVETDIVLNTPIKDGFSFWGWYGMDIDESTPQPQLHIYKMTGNRTYYAKFGEEKYDIQYNLDGGVVPDKANPTMYCMSDKDITLVNPTKAGYTFMGWIGTGLDTATLEVIIPTGSFGNRQYTATYVATRYSITYTLNGGEFELIPKDSFTIEDAEFTLDEPTKNGYTFDGWIFEGGEPKLNFVFNPAENLKNVEFIASYHINTYKIDYDLAGASLGADESNPTTYTVETADFTLNNPTKLGYTFLGWTGSNGNIPDDILTISKGQYYEDLTFTANFEIITYTISYNLDGGSFEGELLYEYNIETPTFYIPNLTKDGYDFLGWTSETITGPTTDVKVNQGSTGNITFTAHFKQKEYTVTMNLNWNGAFYGAHLPSDWELGNPFTYTADLLPITLPIPILTGSIFVGWMPEGTMSTPEVILTIPVGTAENLTYLALFSRDSYAIEYHLEGGEWGNESYHPASYMETDEDITPSDPYRNGYIFSGWNLYDENDSKLPSSTIASGSTGNRKYVATWTARTDIPYTINYYYMNVDGVGYTVVSDPQIGTTDAELYITADPKDGFTLQVATIFNTIKWDGTTTFDFYYDRNQYSVSVSGGEGVSASGSGSYYFEQEVRLTANVDRGYQFDGFFDELQQQVYDNVNYIFNMGTTDLTFTVKATIVEYKISYSYEPGAVFATPNPETYNVKTKTFTLCNPTLAGAVFQGWQGTGIAGTAMTVEIVQGSIGDRSYLAIFTDETFSIEYDYAGGQATAGGSYPNNYTRKNEVIPTVPNRAGYTFSGWILTNAQGQVLTPSYIEEGSTGYRKFTATWTPNTDTPYVVNIYLMDANGQYSSEPNYTNTYYGTTDTKPTITLDDYEGFITPTLDNKTIAGDGSTVFELRYARISYHLTINYDNGIESVTGDIDYYWGQTVYITATPKLGYEFKSWTQTAGTTVFTEGTTNSFSFVMPKDNVTLLASSLIIDYTITYDIGDAVWEGGENPNPLTYNILTGDITIVNPTKLGYTFLGWTGTGIPTPESKLVIPSGTIGNIRLVANFEAMKVSYKVEIYHMNLNGQGYTLIDTITGEAVADTEISPSVPYYEGFTSPQIQTQVVSADGSTVFRYEYIRNQYGVTLSVTKGIESVTGNGMYYYGQEVTITASLKDYYVFNGWKMDNEILSANQSYTFVVGAQEYTITADSEGQTFNIIYDLNTADPIDTSKLIKTYKYGTFSYFTPQVDRVGYELMGWACSTEDKYVGFGTNLTIYEDQHGDIYLKAYWGQQTLDFAFGKLSDGTLAIGKSGLTTLSKDVVIPGYVYINNVVEEGNGDYSKVSYIIDQELYNLSNQYGIENIYKVSTIRGGTFDGSQYHIPGETFSYANINSITIPNTVTTIGIGAFFASSIKTVNMTTSVTTIEAVAFNNCSNLTTIDIPISVTTIGDSAFALSGLTSIVIPDSVVSVGNYAFNGSQLTSVTLSNNLQSIGIRAFQNCTYLSTVNLGSGLTTLPDYLFYNCQSLVNITIPSNVTSIGYGTFFMCKNLTNITFNEGLTTIGVGAFQQTNLVNINFPASLQVIEDSAFLDVNTIKTINFPSNSQLTTIKNAAFQKTNLTSISFPVSLQEIGNSAFLYVVQLKTVNFPSNSQLTTIGQSAFGYTYELQTINIPSTIQSIGDYAFSECHRLYDIGLDGTTNLQYLGQNAFQNCASLIEINLLSHYAFNVGTTPFNLCQNLRKLITNANVTKEVLCGDTCPNLEIRSSNSGFSGTITEREDGVVLWTESGEVSIINYRGDNPELDLSDNTSITIIGDYAFYYNKIVQRLNFSNKITTIGSGAFSYAFNLVRIYIPSTVASLNIEGAIDIFAHSNKLVQVCMFYKFTDIEYDFEYILALDTTTFTNTSFDKYDTPYGEFETVTFNSGKMKGTYLLNYNGTETNIDLSTLKYKPYNGLFCNNYNITNVTLPSDMTEIPDALFAYAVNLQSIEIPSSVQSIGQDAFCSAIRMNSVNWEDLTNLTTINSHAFNLCISLQEIIVPEGVTILNEGVFRGCVNASIELPSTLQRIEAYALQSMKFPVGFTLPTSVTYIHENAFEQCTYEDGTDYTPPFTGERTVSSNSGNTLSQVVEYDDDKNVSYNVGGLLKRLFIA